MTESKVRRKKLPGCVGYGFFGLFAAAGTALFYFFTVAPVLEIYDARSWIVVPCEILSSEVAASHSSDGTTYRVAITYDYEVGGRSFTGDRYDFSLGSSSGYERKARIVERYPVGLETGCYVDPEEPEESVIDRAPGAYLLWGLFPLPFLAVGYGGLLWLFLPGRTRGPADAAPLARGAPSARASASTRGAPARAVAPPSGPQTLSPRHSRLVKLVVMVLVTAFWNGMVGLFLAMAVVPGIADGDVDWIPTLFMIPFVLVGLGLIGAVLHVFLGLFNPVLHVEIDDHHLTNGENCAVRWSFTGRTGRIRLLTVTFEGREAATYRRGTDSVTDHHTFFTEEIVSTTHPAALARGSATLAVPARTMPTFESSNNKVEWRLTFHGDIPNWPDVNEEFPVTVHPEESA